MRIESRGIDPATGQPDRYGVPQIACPARLDDVNPQFTCLGCPCALAIESHQAVDDQGLGFSLVDAVECSYLEAKSALPVVWQHFPNRLGLPGRDSEDRLRPAVECPLLRLGRRPAPLATEAGGSRWIPVSDCGTCQFFRGQEGSLMSAVQDGDAGVRVACALPLP